MIRLFIISLLALANYAFAEAFPRPDHIVIVIEENKSMAQIIGNKDAPYINALARQGTLFTDAHGVTHPSQPNYLALFSGSTHNITNDSCLLELSGDNLASALIQKNLTFISYAENMPATAYLGCMSGPYMRKHNPLSNWLPLANFNQPFDAFARDFSQLPTVSLVVPNLLDDMHDGTIAQGDAWLSQHLDEYAKWAKSHNSLLILTWDEDNGTVENHIATVFVGSMVKSGQSAQHISHYTVLHTISEMYGLPYPGHSADEKSIVDIWKSSGK